MTMESQGYNEAADLAYADARANVLAVAPPLLMVVTDTHVLIYDGNVHLANWEVLR